MEITLNHTIVYVKDNVASALLYQYIFGFDFLKEWGHFAVVRVNETLTLDFISKEDEFTKMHYAFKVNEQEFDEIFFRIQEKELVYGSSPYSLSDKKINYSYNGRGVYFRDYDGHVLEIITQDYVLD
ncbi:Glyoxalase/Bleomycin resistance protein/dioxygenase domain [hydrothermal vent metagenome]|uniref:Glyoxalase/Bleomycin resistance protein/dioxygenase domain n=1 Tax=hydrothermal vent metagenome TaxID=652676 RepID=A0A1W1CL92_9ZZZZ